MDFQSEKIENECPQILGVLAVFHYIEEPLATAMISVSYAPLTSVFRIWYGSGTFLTPEAGIRNRCFRISDPGCQSIFLRA